MAKEKPQTLPPLVPWRQALGRFVERVSESYGGRFHRVVLYGSRARGDAAEVSFDSESIISALPVTLADYETRRSPLLINVRREGVAIS